MALPLAEGLIPVANEDVGNHTTVAEDIESTGTVRFVIVLPEPATHAVFVGSQAELAGLKVRPPVAGEGESVLRGA